VSQSEGSKASAWLDASVCVVTRVWVSTSNELSRIRDGGLPSTPPLWTLLPPRCLGPSDRLGF
jgi:hypothetical protein